MYSYSILKKKECFIVNKIRLILNELFTYRGIIARIAKYEDKATYQSHYLGLAWQILNPLIQIGIYYLVFGVGVNNGRSVGGVPFIAWMLVGISCWFFINNTTMSASNSIHQKIGMVSKMKFPVSILPAVTIVSQLTTFFIMLGIAILCLLLVGITPTLYWLQFIYYFGCLIALLYFCGLFNATMTVLVRDYHIMLQSLMRILFYFSGATWVLENTFGSFAMRLLQLNPVFYIIDGFRDAFLSRAYFFEKGVMTLIFWCFVLFVAILGTHIHVKFRAKFVDFV